MSSVWFMVKLDETCHCFLHNQILEPLSTVTARPYHHMFQWTDSLHHLMRLIKDHLTDCFSQWDQLWWPYNQVVFLYLVVHSAVADPLPTGSIMSADTDPQTADWLHTEVAWSIETRWQTEVYPLHLWWISGVYQWITSMDPYWNTVMEDKYCDTNGVLFPLHVVVPLFSSWWSLFLFHYQVILYTCSDSKRMVEIISITLLKWEVIWWNNSKQYVWHEGFPPLKIEIFKARKSTSVVIRKGMVTNGQARGPMWFCGLKRQRSSSLNLQFHGKKGATTNSIERDFLCGCKETAWQVWLFRVEVTCGGFPTQSLWRRSGGGSLD